MGSPSDSHASETKSDENGCKLFVGGLSHETTDMSLLKYFESFGKVASAVVLRDPETLSSRGFGFVTFSTKKESQNCLNFGSHVVDNKNVETKFALPRNSYNTYSTHVHSNTSNQNGNSSNSIDSNSNSNSPNVSKPPPPPAAPGTHSNQSNSSNPNASKSSLVNVVKKRYADVGRPDAASSSSGNTASVAKPTHQPQTQSQQHSIVSDEGAAYSVNGYIGNDSDEMVDSNNINSEPREESEYIETKIFVGGLLYATVADTLKEYFKKFGTVTMTEIIYNKETKISRGFGFVEFKDYDAVENVISYQENNQRHRVDGKKVEVKRCLKRNDPHYNKATETNAVSSVAGDEPSTAATTSSIAATNPVKTSPDTSAQPSISAVVEPKSSLSAPVKLNLTKKNPNVKITSFAQAAALGTKFEKQDAKINGSSSVSSANHHQKSTNGPVQLEFELDLKFEDTGPTVGVNRLTGTSLNDDKLIIGDLLKQENSNITSSLESSKLVAKFDLSSNKEPESSTKGNEFETDLFERLDDVLSLGTLVSNETTEVATSKRQSRFGSSQSITNGLQTMKRANTLDDLPDIPDIGALLSNVQSENHGTASIGDSDIDKLWSNFSSKLTVDPLAKKDEGKVIVEREAFKFDSFEEFPEVYGNQLNISAAPFEMRSEQNAYGSSNSNPGNNSNVNGDQNSSAPISTSHSSVPMHHYANHSSAVNREVGGVSYQHNIGSQRLHTYNTNMSSLSGVSSIPTMPSNISSVSHSMVNPSPGSHLSNMQPMNNAINTQQYTNINNLVYPANAAGKNGMTEYTSVNNGLNAMNGYISHVPNLQNIQGVTNLGNMHLNYGYYNMNNISMQPNINMQNMNSVPNMYVPNGINNMNVHNMYYYKNNNNNTGGKNTQPYDNNQYWN